MSKAALKVISPGLGATVQDQGRPGWRRWGVPASGAMDDHAAQFANRLLANPPEAPLLELLLQGARLVALQDVWIAVTGADAGANVPAWRAFLLPQGATVEFLRNRSGVWTYLAVAGGFESPIWFGSASAYPRGGLGRALTGEDVLGCLAEDSFQFPPGVAGREAFWTERRDYESPPALRVWPGPQWDIFNVTDRGAFFNQEWEVTSRSDRVGYRLAGRGWNAGSAQIISEPVRVGSIQIPPGGQPIVTMRDGPTVGGYPKLGLVHPEDLSWLAQCRPGQKVQFRLEEA